MLYKLAKIVALSIATTLVSCLPSVAQAQVIKGQVIKIIDGDTIRTTIDGNPSTVRLACIDAAELDQAPFGKVAAKQLEHLLPIGQWISMKVTQVDHYSRVVAEVYRGAESVNLEMVQLGQAKVNHEYVSKCPELSNRLFQAEVTAKQTKLAFWSQSYPMMPWDFRRSNVQNTDSTLKVYTAPTVSNSSLLRSQLEKALAAKQWSQAYKLLDQLMIAAPQDSAIWSSYKSALQSSLSPNSSDDQPFSYEYGYPSNNVGSCEYSWQLDSIGRLCGNRAASQRPNIIPNVYQPSPSYNSPYSGSSYSPTYSGSERTYVRSYTRKDGTRVRSHYRRR